MKKALTLFLLAPLLMFPPLSGRAESSPQKDTLVILDNDFLGPGGSNMQSLLYLMGVPHVRILGIDVVAGDDQEPVESAHVRALLARTGRTDIPVYDGAVTPLLNTPEAMQARELQYGTTGWHGAWGKFGTVSGTPKDLKTEPFPEGQPTIPAQAEPAAAFLVAAARKYPGQITLIAGGPLTNIAMAVRMDPQFTYNIRKFVFMGGQVNGNAISGRDPVPYSHDFNIRFDPEAAEIVLKAHWNEIVSVSPPATKIQMGRNALSCGRTGGLIDTYVARYHQDFPMWDEITAAVALHPSLITSASPLVLDVDTHSNMSYGYLRIQPDKEALPAAQRVEVVYGVHKEAFKSDYSRALCNLDHIVSH